MAINFPDSPSVGDEFTGGGFTWTWSGSSWEKVIDSNESQSTDFVLNVGTSGDTTYSLDRSYQSGVYFLNFANDDAIYDIYFVAEDGSFAGYTNTLTAIATNSFNKVVVLNANSGEIIYFNYQGTSNQPSADGDQPSAGAFIESVSVTSLPGIDDTTIVYGGNFATDVSVKFIDQLNAEMNAKAIVRSSTTELIVTRPDDFSPDNSPYTVQVTNPGIPVPAASESHLLVNSVTAGTNPTWQSDVAQPYDSSSAVSISLSASDSDGPVTYSIVSGSLPAGLSLDVNTGNISGTPDTADESIDLVTIRATDDGGNFLDRQFSFLANQPPVWITQDSDLVSFVEGNAANFQFSVDGGIVGTTIVYSVQSGNLPNGTSLSSAGLLSGATSAVGSYSFTVRAEDEYGLFSDKNFNVDVLARPGSISSTPASSGGQVILSGFGFEAWDDVNSNSSYSTFNFTVPANVTKLRAIAIGGGGGSSGSLNIVAGGGGSGVEGFINVTPGQTIECRVGRGGSGVGGGSAGSGGESSILINGTAVLRANGGAAAGSAGTAATYFYDSNSVQLISGADGGSTSSLSPSNISVSLAGATAHAGGAGKWNGGPGAGVGFGGGGGFAGNSFSATSGGAGGIYGYRGGAAHSGSSVRGGGPVGGWASDSQNLNGGGGGGGSFGGAGVDGWSGGQGAGGLVRIWWASSQADVSWIESGANYV